MAQPANKRRRHWIPDLAALLSAVTLYYCLFVFDGGRKLFRDSDTGWHIRTGERILEGGGLPRTDPYSFSRPGAEWFAWEWGADVLMAAAHRAGGLQGVALLFSLVIAVCSWLWCRLHWAVEGDFLLACVMAAPMLSTANLHWLARPHVFSWVLLLLALLWLERGGGSFAVRDAALAILLGTVWANLHASFFFAPLFAVLYAIGARSANRRWYLFAAAGTAAGTLLNPYGLELHRHLFRYLTNTELLDRVGEFQSFNFHVDGAAQIAAAVLLAAMGAAVALMTGRWAHGLIALLLVAVALRSARALPLVALLALPLANGAVAAALRTADHLPAWIGSAFEYSRRLRILDRRANGLATVLGAALLAVILFRTPALAARAGFPPEEFPVAASAAIEAQVPGTARLFAPDKFGGYLIYRFSGARKVYFDGRSDFYGVDFMKQYIRMVELRPGWRRDWNAGNFTHALVPAKWSLRGALEESGWRVLYQDEVAVLLAAR